MQSEIGQRWHQPENHEWMNEKKAVEHSRWMTDWLADYFQFSLKLHPAKNANQPSLSSEPKNSQWMTAPRWAVVASAKVWRKVRQLQKKRDISWWIYFLYPRNYGSTASAAHRARVGNLMRTSALMSMQIALTQIIISLQRAITRLELKRLFYDPTRDLHITSHDSPVWIFSNHIQKVLPPFASA